MSSLAFTSACLLLTLDQPTPHAQCYSAGFAGSTVIPPTAACACVDMGEVYLLRGRSRSSKQRNTSRWARRVFVFQPKLWHVELKAEKMLMLLGLLDLQALVEALLPPTVPSLSRVV